MPIIDIYAPIGLFPDHTDRALADRIATVLMTAEGYPPPAPPQIKAITGVYIHHLPPAVIHTAATAFARTVRVQVLTFPDALDDATQLSAISQITDIVVDLTNDFTQRERTFVIFTEALAGGWGVNGVRPTPTALGMV